MSDDLLVYPTDKVVGIADDRAALDRVRRGLQDAGVDDGRVEVLSGEQGQDLLDPDGDQSGAFASVIRRVQKTLGEEAHRIEELNDAVEAGAYVVQVALPDDGDEDAAKREIGGILHRAGARNVAFYGSLAVEEIQIGA